MKKHFCKPSCMATGFQPPVSSPGCIFKLQMGAAENCFVLCQSNPAWFHFRRFGGNSPEKEMIARIPQGSAVIPDGRGLSGFLPSLQWVLRQRWWLIWDGSLKCHWTTRWSTWRCHVPSLLNATKYLHTVVSAWCKCAESLKKKTIIWARSPICGEGWDFLGRWLWP